MSRSTRRSATRAAALTLSCLFLAACATDRATRDEGAEASTPPALLADATPVSGRSAVLWVHGMSCPKCVSNVDLQLKRLPGVDTVAINMGLGSVAVTYAGAERPTPQQLARAVDNAGLTLLRIEEVQ